jgi:hypothetical protein
MSIERESIADLHKPIMHTQDAPKPVRKPQGQGQSTFRIPAPLKSLFDKFPLVTYRENDLPLRALSKSERGENILYVFNADEDARQGKPSYNPACLRWQVRNLSRRSNKPI